MESSIAGYFAVLLFIGSGALFLGGTFFISRLLRPSHPDPEKLSAYECGEEAEGSGQIQFNSRFFIIALIFVLFEVEILFVFPWALIANHSAIPHETNSLWGTLVVLEMGVFVGILAIGLAYAIVKGHLDWIKPETIPTKLDYKIPLEAYKNFTSQTREVK